LEAARVRQRPRLPRMSVGKPRSGARMQPTAQAVGKEAAEASPDGVKEMLGATPLKADVFVGQRIYAIPDSRNWRPPHKHPELEAARLRQRPRLPRMSVGKPRSGARMQPTAQAVGI
jgi:hypothetical protein